MNEYRLSEISKLTPTVNLLTLEKISGGDFSFVPGQYAALHFKRRGRRTPVRCFSIVSSPRQPDKLQFATKKMGDFTGALSELEVGEEVYIQGPFGDFVIDFDHDKSLVLLAGGIGVTPYISMLRYLTEIKSKLPVTLVYSYGDEDDAAFLPQLKSLAKQNPYFNLITNQGRLEQAVLDEIVSAADQNATYFLCGPPKFMDSIGEQLKRLDIPEHKLVMEAFGQRGAGATNALDQSSHKVYKLSTAGVLLGFALLAAGNFINGHHAAAAVKRATNSAESAIDSSQDEGSSTDDSSVGPTATDNSTSNTNNSGTTNSSSTDSGSSANPTTTQTYQSPMSTVS